MRSGQCPLLAQSGHSNRSLRCPLSGVKRTWRCTAKCLLMTQSGQHYVFYAHPTERLGDKPIGPTGGLRISHEPTSYRSAYYCCYRIGHVSPGTGLLLRVGVGFDMLI